MSISTNKTGYTVGNLQTDTISAGNLTKSTPASFSNMSVKKIITDSTPEYYWGLTSQVNVLNS